MSDRTDAARECWEYRDDPDEWSEGVEVIYVRPRRSSVVSFRLSDREMNSLEKALEDSGIPLSDYIRCAISDYTAKLRRQGYVN